MSKGRLVVISGPSAVGKDTVINAWHKANPDVERVVAYATRSPREGEVDGVDYRFVSDDEFKRLASTGKLLEFEEVYGNSYGTPLADTERILGEGRIAVLKIDVKGAMRVMALRQEALTVFLHPPSDEELRRRIEARAADSPEVTARRLAAARDEIAQSCHYQFQVVNRDVDEVVERLQELTRR